MKNLFLNTYLILAGSIIMLVGMYISLATVEYLQAMNLDQAEQSISLLSDLRGMGGLLLVAGGYVVLGVFKPALKSSSLWAANAVYISFVAFMKFRTTSRWATRDGYPDRIYAGDHIGRDRNLVPKIFI